MSCDMEYYIDNIAVDLAGRAAESILQNSDVKRYTSGASEDLISATNTARAIITQFGMLETLGENMAYLGNYDYRDFGLLSETSKEDINTETEKLVKEAMNRAKTILNENIVLLKTLANELLTNEVLDERDLDKICNDVLLQKET